MHSTDKMDDDYLGSGQILRYSVKKYGPENHVREVLQLFSDRASLIQGEKELVTESVAAGPMCMNMCAGGATSRGGPRQKRPYKPRGPMPEETRLKISLSNMGKKHSKATRRKMSKAKLGKTWTWNKPMSDEQKKQISDTLKGKKLSPWNKGIKMGPLSDEQKQKLSMSLKGKNKGKKMSDAQKELLRQINLGKKHTAEAKARMSASKKGKKKPPRSAEHCKNMSEAHKGKVLSEEHKRNISEGMKIACAKKKQESK